VREQRDLESRIQLLSVPLDIVTDIETSIDRLLARQESSQIVFLGLWDFVRARSSSLFAIAVRNAALVVPTSRIVVQIAWLLRKVRIPRYIPFNFVIRVLSVIEKRGRTLYMIGSRPRELQLAASNVRGSFPELQIVGVCAGYFETGDEENIILAIRKAAPTLVLAGYGVPGRERWPHIHREKFSTSMSVWCGPCVDMFSGKRTRTSRRVWVSGLDFVPSFLTHPWRIYRLFVYVWLLFVVLLNRVRRA